MKKYSLLFSLVLFAVIAQAQNPVNWTFTSKKINDKTYEVHMTANIQAGWHVFSQTQPDDAIAIPTSFVINSNPLVKLDGKVKEEGKLEKFKDEKLDIAANQYSNKVNFVQVVKLKGTAKTNVSGTVEFQTCNEEKCLPPRKINFTVAIQ
jgi:hypothetical protein